MKKSTKLVIFLVFAIIFATMLASCHGKEEKIDIVIPTDFDTSKQYSITFWAKNENNATQRGVYDEAIRKFEEYYPNIDVTIEHFTDYGEIYNKVITNIQTNTTPNVCITYPDHIATYLTGGNTVVTLDELLTDSRYGLGGSEVAFDSPAADQIVPKFLEECSFNGHYYAIPYMRSTEACYINKT